MGKCDSEKYALIFCFVGLVLLAQQGSVLSKNKNILNYEEKEIVAHALPSLATSFSDMTKKELKSLSSSSSSSSKTPILGLFGEALMDSIPLLSQHITEEFIATVVTHAGFFPSNVAQTLQDLLEYNSVDMAVSVSNLLQGVSMSYWREYQDTRDRVSLKVGNYLKLISEVMAIVGQVTPLTQNTQIPEQDSWLGNFFVSWPNIAYESSSNSTSWIQGFGNASSLFSNYAAMNWKGSYYGSNDKSNLEHWSCDKCDRLFRGLSKQFRVISQGPYFAPHSEYEGLLDGDNDAIKLDPIEQVSVDVQDGSVDVRDISSN